IKTAVVLPDESLLVSLLHSLPEHIEKINVTMGFPLKATPASGLMDHIFELHRRMNSKEQFYYLTVSNILNHQYINMLCGDEVRRISEQIVKTNAMYIAKEMFLESELLSLIFRASKKPKQFVEYLLDVLNRLNMAWQQLADGQNKYRLECDYLYEYYTAINRMNDVMQTTGNELEMSLDTLIRLIRQLIGGISIPFQGEPLDGLQVMGALETRGLDFENLIICSFNEGIYPKKNSSVSFIPYNLRRAFELPTADCQDATSAYNFYRLIQRTKRLFFLYDSRTEGMQTGEVSRYVHQLNYLYEVNFKKINIAYNVSILSERDIQIRKTPKILEQLHAFLTEDENARSLSASSINTYIHCPLQFYFSSIEMMTEPEEVQEKVESAMFGTLLHFVMEHLYKPFEGKMVQRHHLENLRKNSLLIDKAILNAFAVKFFNKEANAAIDFELQGNNLLIARVLRKFILEIIRKDEDRAPFQYIESEKRIVLRYPIYGASEYVNLKGLIDRVDEKEGIIRILDYKSGQDKLEFNSLDEVFERNMKERPKAVLQTFLYSLLYIRETRVMSISPEILKVRDLFKREFNTQITDKGKKRFVENFYDYKTEFEDRLTDVLEEIFNPEIPFVQCDNVALCEYCSFKTICKR
ncbi:MAG: PD-(D/E)XK nuclease family protein, partial [Paludibacteraceae bacterium]